MRKWLHFILFIVALPVLFLIALANWRVDSFQIIDENGGTLIIAPARVGNVFTTRYIHSVEKTPVEDEFRIVRGQIWMWEERVRSSNAGLPSMRPVNGRFIATPEWFVYQGGRVSVKEYYYRVGNERFGLNQSNFEPFGLRNFYEIFKGERLLVRVQQMPFRKTRLYVSEKIAASEANVAPIMAEPNQQ